MRNPQQQTQRFTSQIIMISETPYTYHWAYTSKTSPSTVSHSKIDSIATMSTSLRCLQW